MSERRIVGCNGCGKEPINEEYRLYVGVRAELPESGGISTGMELNRRFDFCAACKQEVQRDLLALLLKRREPKP